MAARMSKGISKRFFGWFRQAFYLSSVEVLIDLLSFGIYVSW